MRYTRSNKTSKNRKLTIQKMEDRRLMAADVYLDFDGATQTEVDSVTSEFVSWRDRPTRGGILGFEDGFARLNANFADYSFLDFNGDSRLDQTDGDIARGLVLRQVRQDFAPYDVNIIEMADSSVAQRRMRASSTNDTLVFISGDGGFAGGQSPRDIGNRQDNVAAAGDTRGIADWATSGAMFVNVLANFISHEVGHSFGLGHLNESAEPALNNRTLMDPFLLGVNMGFTDVDYRTDDGTMQNEHEYLVSTIGASDESWVAVLRPGEITIQGDVADDHVVVSTDGASRLVIADYGRSGPYMYQIDVGPASSRYSLNRFDTGITRIVFRGGDGDDILNTRADVDVPVYAWGGNGDDRLSGGSGRDLLRGEEGNDRLEGRDSSDRLFGGSGNDFLQGDDGNDYLSGGDDRDTILGDGGDDLMYGGNGHDYMYGGNGRDTMFGGNGNDYMMGQAGRDVIFGEAGGDTLDGGFDGEQDRLNGGSGSDRLVDHRRLRRHYDFINRRWVSSFVSEDILQDLASDDQRLIRNHA